MSTTPTGAPCAARLRSLPRPSEISVNGVLIDRATISLEAQNHPAATAIEAWLAAARALVVRELLLQEARRVGTVARPEQDEEGRRETDEEALIRAHIEQQVVTPAASAEECRRYYQHNQHRFRSPTIIEARHILFAAHPGDHHARQAAKGRAEAALAALAAAPDRFEALAAELSDCPSARAGGNLGQITRGQTIPEFEAALDRLQPGEQSERPIETRYGFHIVRLERRVGGEVLPFEAVHRRIAAWLEEKARRRAVHRYIAGLAEAAQITGISLQPASPDAAC